MGSLRVRLLVPLFAVALPLTLVTILAIQWDQDRRQREVAAHVEAIAETANIILGHALVAGENLLDSLDGHARLRAGGPACSTLLFEIRSAGIRYASIGVADASGRVYCASPVPSGSVSIADRGYFQRTVQTSEFSVGEVQLGRLSGIPTIAFARPTSVVSDGVLFASLDLNWLTGLLEPLAQREEVLLLLVDSSGELVAVSGTADVQEARDLAAAGRSQGVGVTATGQREYVVASSPLTTRRGQEVGVMLAAAPRAPIVAQGERTLALALATLALTVAGGVGGALLLNQRLIIQPIQRIRDAATGMSRGQLDLQLHSGRNGEIGELEQALDAAAAEIAAGREALAEVAYHDSTTGALTRQGLEREASELLERHAAFGVFYLTTVGFHQLTATFGHPASEEVLRTIRRRLAALPRARVGRVGGNAFGVLVDLESSEPDDELRLIARRVVELFQQPVDVRGVNLRVSVLLGASRSPAHGQDFDLLLRRAEVVAREVRGELSGVVFNPERHESRINNVGALANLRQAMERDELELHYQPVVELSGGALRKAEALIRWPAAPEALRAPDIFIPLAERSGVIGDLDRWVVSRAVRQMADWHRSGTGTPAVAVNVSAHSFQDASFPDFVEDLLAQHQLPPSSIGFEITETALVTYFDDALNVCRRLRDLGILISVDDFGIGHSPVLYLRDFPVAEIKVDRSLIREAPEDSGIAGIVRALTGMAVALDVSVVAEGVETAEQRRAARALGCELGQGWLFARAMPPDEFTAWARR